MSDNFDLNEYDIGLDANSIPLENSSIVAAQHVAALQDQDPVTQIDDLGVQDLGVDTAVSTTRVRKPVAKLDTDRLLNPYKGYPALLKAVKRLKYRKGHEKRYLQKYVMTHQIWANRVWPKANFDDFVLIARNVGKDARVRSYIRELIENEKYGRSSNRQENGSKEDSSGQRKDERNKQGGNEEDRTEMNNSMRPHPLLSEHTKDLPKDIDSDLEIEFLQSVGKQKGKEQNGREPDEFEEMMGPDEDELEAARELYGDMDF